jgi:hypothetical protein
MIKYLSVVLLLLTSNVAAESNLTQSFSPPISCSNSKDITEIKKALNVFLFIADFESWTPEEQACIQISNDKSDFTITNLPEEINQAYNGNLKAWLDNITTTIKAEYPIIKSWRKFKMERTIQNLPIKKYLIRKILKAQQKNC